MSNLRAAVKQRYNEAVDYKEYEDQIRNMVDKYIGADEVRQIIKPVNVFQVNNLAAELEGPDARAIGLLTGRRRGFVLDRCLLIHPARRMPRAGGGAYPPPRPSRRPRSGDLDRQLVDLGRRVAGLLVDPHHGLLRGARRETEDLAQLGVEPGVLEVHALLGLNIEVALVRLGKLLAGDAEEPRVNVHELRHWMCAPW